MKFFKLFVLMAAAVVANPTLAAGDAEAGEAKAATCAACHGPGGSKPIAGNYPKLAGQGEAYLVKQLQDYKSGDRENAIMAGQVANLSEQDIADLGAYYASQEAEAGQADPDWVEQGAKLYRGGDMANGLPSCSGCHGPAGQGVDGAKYPHLAGQNAQYVEEQLKAFRAAGRNDLGDNVVKRTNDPASMMQTVAAKMSDSQIKAVASYITGLSK